MKENEMELNKSELEYLIDYVEGSVRSGRYYVANIENLVSKNKDGRACALCNSFFVLPMRLEGIKKGGFVKPDDGQDIEECSKARELWIEQNCECGISEKTGKWSEKVFKSFGCNCREAV